MPWVPLGCPDSGFGYFGRPEESPVRPGVRVGSGFGVSRATGRGACGSDAQANASNPRQKWSAIGNRVGQR